MTFLKHPDVLDLCRQSGRLTFPELAFDDRMYEALVEVVRCLPDDRWGHSIVAVARMIFGCSGERLYSIAWDDWPVPADEVLDSLRSCRNTQEAVAYIDAMTRPIVNEDWRATSEFLHLVNPLIFPVWSNRVGWHFGLTTRGEIDSKAAYRAWVEFAGDAVSEHGRALQQAVSRHLVILVTPIRALSLLLSWFAPAAVECPANAP